MKQAFNPPRKGERTSTVGRGRSIEKKENLEETKWEDKLIKITYGDSLEQYQYWPSPTCIVSDGGYGILGFEGDTSSHSSLPFWYERHIAEWSKTATPQTTLWFWNSEIGWATVHPILEKYGWKYVNANIWNKGTGHIAGNVNTAKIRRFPVTTEICVQYVLEGRVNGTTLQDWIISEWERSGLPRNRANIACGVKDAAARKYLDRGHLWYFPPPEMFEKLQAYANKHGRPEGRPYFSLDGTTPATATEWEKMRAKFNCPYGTTNVWDRASLRGSERHSIAGGKNVHLNQKPLDLMETIIKACTDENDVVWEPFGGLFSAAIAARRLRRAAFSCEIDSTYFYHGLERVKSEALLDPLP